MNGEVAEYNAGYDEGYKNGMIDGEGVGEDRGRRLERERGVEVTLSYDDYGYNLGVDTPPVAYGEAPKPFILIPLEDEG